MDAIILMSRIPYKGMTKTRLMPILSPTECQELHHAFIEDYFLCFHQLNKAIAIFIAYAPENFYPDFLKSIPKDYGHYMQVGDNIGIRMYNAFQHLFDKGYKKVVLVGCDIPHIQSQTYVKAFAALENKDMVISPTYDGGYCLIGLKANCKALFINEMSWGNTSVIDQTYKIANTLNLGVEVLEKHRDIDEFEDLLALQNFIVPVTPYFNTNQSIH